MYLARLAMWAIKIPEIKMIAIATAARINAP